MRIMLEKQVKGSARPGGVSSSLLTKSGLKPRPVSKALPKHNHACVLMLCSVAFFRATAELSSSIRDFIFLRA